MDLLQDFGISRDVLESIICGGIAGIAAKTAIAPAERVKMSYQVSSEHFTLTDAYKRGIGIIRSQGVFALWKGHLTTVVRVGPFSGISYSVHDYTEARLKQFLMTDRLPFMYKFLAGSIGGAVATIFTYPLDVLRVRLALTPGSSWMSTFSQGGLYQGLTPTVLGIIPYSGTAWMVKQTLHECYGSFMKRKPQMLEALTMNAIAGLAGQFVTYPLDITRRRMQMARPDRDGRLHGLWYYLRHLFFTEGFRGLTKGFSLNVIKGPITLSISLTMYDHLLEYAAGLRNDSDSSGSNEPCVRRNRVSI